MKLNLPEIVAIGIYNSNLAIKNVSITKKRKTTMFEIEIPIENGGISYINTTEEAILPDMIICAKPGQTRHSKLPYKCYFAHLIFPEGELYELLMNIPNYIKTNKYNEYLEIFKELCKYYENAVNTDEIILQSLILKLIYLLNSDSKKLILREKIKETNHKAIGKAIKYIKENLTSDLSLEVIAKNVGFSPIHFHNVFKASTGRTPREYVEDQRIRKAANILITTDYTLAQIAYECGFSSQSYFSYAFKRKMKKTPREYAKEVFERYEESK